MARRRATAQRNLRELLVLPAPRELRLRYKDTAVGFIRWFVKRLLLGTALYLAVRRAFLGSASG